MPSNRRHRYAPILSMVILGCALLSCTPELLKVESGSVYSIDGDTVKIAGENYRLTGYDTPETYRAKCAAEKVLGNKATARLRVLIASVDMVTLEVEYETDKYNRKLARLFVGDRDVGNILIGEGLARPYFGGKRQSWC